MMAPENTVSEHVRQCVKLLNEELHTTTVPAAHKVAALEAIFELVDMPWDQASEDDAMFREGYETCLLDIVDAVSQAWGVSLPQLPVKMEAS